MDKRKVFKICMSIFLFFVILAIIEISVRGISSKISDIVTAKKEEKEEYEFYNSESEVAKRNVKDFANNILEAIVDKDYEYVIYYFNETYLKYFYDGDKTKAKADLENYIEDGATYLISDITDVDNKYYVSIVFSKEDTIHTKYLTIYDLANGSYNVMFGYYNYVTSSGYSTQANGLRFENTYTYSVGGTRVYPVSIYNNSGKEVEIEFIDVYTLGITGTQRKFEKPENIKINQEENQKIDLVVGNFTEELVSINLKVKIDGVESTVKMYSNNGSRAWK